MTFKTSHSRFTTLSSGSREGWAYAGTGKDELTASSCSTARRNGKSKFIEDFAEPFPEDARGEISDNAEEQWWSAHLWHPMNKQERR